MSPVTGSFYAFAALGWVLVWLGRRWGGSRAASWVLSCWSGLFLWLSSPFALAAFAASVLINFGLASSLRAQSKPHHLRRLLFLSVAVNILLIFSPKIFRLFGSQVAFLGLSYYSIQQIMFLYDLYEERLDDGRAVVGGDGSFANYLGFLAFFPQLTSGPICAWRETGKALTAPNPRPSSQWLPGALMITHGLFHKLVISTWFSAVSQAALSNPEAGRAETLIGLVFSYLALYFDFSGYTDIAMGTAWFFGVTLPLNFDQPLRANSLADLWARWHMSLSAFVKNYIYFPVFRAYPTRKRLHQLAMLLSMMVVGVWHEPSARFLCFGTLHGLGLLYWPFKRAKSGFHYWASWLATHLFMALSMAFFIGPDLNGALNTLAHLTHASQNLSFLNASFDNYDKLQILACCVLAGLHVRHGKNTQKLYSKAAPSGYLFGWFVLTLSLVLLYMNSGISGNFVYADF
ncbi:MBOAT family protein [bacterium]|nr:MBOAT family protein [bacterium]